jgi:hypothetical protein
MLQIDYGEVKFILRKENRRFKEIQVISFPHPLPPLQPVSSGKTENFPAGEGKLVERGLRPLSLRTPALSDTVILTGECPRGALAPLKKTSPSQTNNKRMLQITSLRGGQRG